MPRRVKSAPKGKRYPLNMRTTQELRSQIETAARASGRSLVQEVEYRLDRSFEPAFDPRHAALFRFFAGIIAIVEAQTNKRWDEDVETRALLVSALKHALSSLEPTARARIADALAQPVQTEEDKS
jgi:hypothetical protein